MPNTSEKEILKKICKFISYRKQQCTAKDYLIMLFEDYLNIQPVQKHFFLVITNLRRLQNASEDPKENKSLVIDVLNNLGKLPVKYLQEAEELLVRLKLFLQIQPEYIRRLNKDYLAFLNPNPGFFTVEQELPVVVSKPPPPNPDDNFSNLSSSEASEYLATIKDVDRYINLLNKLPPPDIARNISTLVLDSYNYPELVHSFNMTVLSKCFDKISESLLPKLLTYALWLLQQKHEQLFLYTLSVLGKLYQRGLTVPLTDIDHNGPFQQSKLLGLVYWLFNSEKMLLAERLKILDDINLILPKAVNVMLEFFCDGDGFISNRNIFIIIEKISLASEEQKLQLVKNILMEHLFYDDRVYKCVADIYNQCNDETKLAIKMYFLSPIVTKCTHHNVSSISHYRELFIPKDKSREAIDSLMNLLRDSVHNENYVSYVLKELAEVFSELELDDLGSITTICLPLLDSFRKDWEDRPKIAYMLKMIMEKSKDLADIIVQKILIILSDIAAESDDKDFTRQLYKIRFILQGKVNYITDVEFFNSLCLRLSRVIRNNITEYFRFLSEAVDGKLKYTVGIEQLDKAQEIVKDLSNFIPAEIFERIGEDCLVYLAAEESHDKPATVGFVAKNFQYFPITLQKKMFNTLLPGIIPYNNELGANQMTFFCELPEYIVPHKYRPDIAHKYYASNYEDNIGFAKTVGYMLLKAFSLNIDGTINSKNAAKIIYGIYEKCPWAMPRYMNKFDDENYALIEKYVMLLANSYAEEDLDESKKNLRDAVNRNQYNKYYYSAIKEMLTENLNIDNDLSTLVMNYLGPRDNTLRP
jgi:hypothetical protein